MRIWSGRWAGAVWSALALGLATATLVGCGPGEPKGGAGRGAEGAGANGKERREAPAAPVAPAAPPSAESAWVGPGNGQSLTDYLGCLRGRGVALVSAHRGGSGPGFPENALETFARTLAGAPVLLEVDVRATKDGALVLLHDDVLDRVTTCTGPLADVELDKLRSCRLKDREGKATTFGAPTLAAALDWAKGRTVLQLDLKEAALFPDTLKAVRAAGAQDRVIIITYARRGSALVAGLDDRVVISASADGEADLDALIEAGVPLARVLAWTGTREPDAKVLGALDRRGVGVIVGTLGPPDRSVDGRIARGEAGPGYAEIAVMGADIIATDRPIEAYRALTAARDPRADFAACRKDDD